MSLTARPIVVTGATRGIGKVTATHLASLGAHVVLVGRSVERGEKVAHDIRAAGGRAELRTGDVTREDDLIALFDGLVADHGSIGAVVNNAAATDVATRDRPVTEQSTEDFDHFVRSGLHSVFWAFKYGIPAMKGTGCFVTISSIAARTASAGQPTYGAVKAAAAALTQQVAVEYGAQGIRANVLTLGFVRTNASAPLLDDPIIGAAVHGSTGGRPPTSDDVARAVAFLLSEDSAGFNGAELVLDRGMTATSPLPDLRRPT